MSESSPILAVDGLHNVVVVVVAVDGLLLLLHWGITATSSTLHGTSRRGIGAPPRPEAWCTVIVVVVVVRPLLLLLHWGVTATSSTLRSSDKQGFGAPPCSEARCTVMLSAPVDEVGLGLHGTARRRRAACRRHPGGGPRAPERLCL